ncbi:glycosyltransferase [Sphingobacterium sp. HJSM2_6]|uniref:glycosyltransferase n=1 Tax=Sphingobacterium sp. HJSM2_6 TaxID=3366264 RepID=UPI003BC4EA33
MKILQLGKFYPIRGGVEKVMYDLMIGLSQRDAVQCDMLCASTEDYPASEITLNEQAKLFIMPTSLKLAATMISPAMIVKLKKIAHNYDIIHIHHPDPMATLALWFSGFKGKVVLHWHSDILKQKLLLKFYQPLLNWLIKRADKIIGTTPVYVRESEFLKNDQLKIDYIPIGISPLSIDYELANRLKEKYGNRKVLLSIGRLVEYKGYEYLLNAVAKLPKDILLLIGGKGPLEEELKKKIIDLGISNQVEFLGYIPDEHLGAYYELSDVFCLSSIQKTEAFAIVQIEAMSNKIPVVSTDIPGSGVSWVNQHGVSGLVVPIMDADALAEAINKLFSDDKFYSQLSESAFQHFQNNFTLNKMIEKTLKIYSEIN